MRLHALAALLALLVSTAARAQSETPPTLSVTADAPVRPDDGEDLVLRVGEVKVEGQRRVEADAIRAALINKPGAAYDRLKVTDDIRGLFKLGYFQDVVIEADQVALRRINLTIRVVEKPAIREVKLVGNDELSNDDLKDLVEVKSAQILDREALRKSARKLTDKYVEKGFYLAEVTPEVLPQPDNLVDVHFQIRENAKVQVKAITFVGNGQVSSEELRGVMETQEGNVLSFFTNAGTYREEVFQRDLSILQFAYYDRGFINVRVGKPQVAITPDKRGIFLTVPITEGEPFDLGKIDVTGDLVLPKEKLLARVKSAPAARFNRSQLQADISAINDAYLDEGYAYVNVVPLTDVDADKKIVDLTFEIQKGPRTHIERIDIVGNTKTRDKVIRRELRVYEGELFSGTGMKVSKQRITALGFFENVEVTQKKGTREDTVIIEVAIKEKATGTFQVGFGFSSIESFILTANVQQNNFLGWGQTVSASVQWSSLRSMIQASYFDPYFLDTNWIFATDFSRIDADYYGFLRRSTGGSLTFGYHLLPDLLGYAAYSFEKVNVEPSQFTGTGTASYASAYANFGTDLLLANRFRSGINSTVKLTLTYDRRDNRLFATSGHYESATVEFGPSQLQGTYNFIRYTGNVRLYYPLIFGAVIKTNLNAGWIQPIQGTQLPISELYYVGGINSVRGYTLRSITPTERVGISGVPDSSLTHNPEFPVGGDKQWTMNLELEFPIVEKIGIRGVLFYDNGNVWAPNENFFQDKRNELPLSLYHSVGAGIRWFSPIGPLRFELGIPLTRRLGFDQPTDFQFTIGQFF